jgi:hypothetical protein
MCTQLQPLDEMFRKIVSERPEVRSAVSDKKGKKVLEYSNTSVSSIWTKLEQAGVALQYDSHPFQQDHEAVVPWDSIPPELDPLAGSLTSERANRKRLQIENLVLLAKTVLRDGDTVVDFWFEKTIVLHSTNSANSFSLWMVVEAADIYPSFLRGCFLKLESS